MAQALGMSMGLQAEIAFFRQLRHLAAEKAAAFLFSQHQTQAAQAAQAAGVAAYWPPIALVRQEQGQ